MEGSGHGGLEVDTFTELAQVIIMLCSYSNGCKWVLVYYEENVTKGEKLFTIFPSIA